MATALFALGLVLAIEGLVWALAPSAIEGMLEALRRMPIETRRLFGLGALALGVVLVLLGRSLGA